MTTFSGHCTCKNVTFSLQTMLPASAISPRACDCDYCLKHQGIYLSDPQGRIQLRSINTLTQVKHGSQQAIFWQCSHCGELVAVSIDTDKGTIGACNYSLLLDKQMFPKPVTVSPKKLSAQEKAERWQRVWTPMEIIENQRTISLLYV